MLKPKNLVRGDLIYVVAPAKNIEVGHIEFCKKFFEDLGFLVEVGLHTLNTYNYFSGTDEERLTDFQLALDHPKAKAIVCARGGYGAVRILDELNWDQFKQKPKWLVGFSDITVFHLRCSVLKIMSLHATMPLNFSSNSKAALLTLNAALLGESFEINAPTTPFNREGISSGKLIGGNLSIIFSLIGTSDTFDFEGAILFLEDLSEQHYHIDRMLIAFKKAGVFDKINGLIIGGMTDLKDTTPSFGMTYEEIIIEKMEGINVPRCFDFPTGHIDDNRAMIIGADVELDVNAQGATLRYV
ncbi:MAG: LD-carboxypeptidase [Crocinitomicaceae bacterium]|nr:LD-carboxypeptidase [Crocinitomicaceae bacterium]